LPSASHITSSVRSPSSASVAVTSKSTEAPDALVAGTDMSSGTVIFGFSLVGVGAALTCNVNVAGVSL
jgi:hypothetical protein